MKRMLPVMMGVHLALAAAAATAEEPAQKQIKLAIQSQTLRDALNEWAQQTGFQLIFATSEETTRVVSPSITGTLSAEAALSRLLAGTKLTYEWIGERSVAIRERVTPTSSSAGWEGNDPGKPPVRLAQLTSDEVGREAATRVVPIPGRTPETGMQRDAIIDEVIVTGSNLRRAGEGPAPVTVFDRERIDQLGATSVADVLDYLPQQPFAMRDAQGFGGARTIRLRGLGLGTTLVLLNGRRTVTSALQGSSNVFDLNTIPLGAVERIEVLSDSASAIYGADAVGGVLNVITRSVIDRPQVSVSYGAADGGADERRASLLFGYAGERLRASAIVEGFSRDLLLGAERDLYANQDYTRFGSIDRRSASGNPGNVSSLTAANLPGLSSRFAAVPVGSTGIALTPQDFVATAGTRNMESLNRFLSVVPEADRLSGVGFAEFDISDGLSAFAEILYTDNEGSTAASQATSSALTVPGTNPFNPFGVPVSVSYRFEGLELQSTVSESEAFRGVGGIRGQIRSWEWELAVLSFDEDGTSKRLNTIDSARVTAALASADPAQALNVFADGPGASPAVLASLVAAPVVNTYSSEAVQGSGFVRGPLIALPAGPVEAVLGAETREEEIHFEARPAIIMDAQRKTVAAYAEVRVPIIGKDMGIPLAHALTVSVAGRNDHYDDFGDSFNPQYGLTWNLSQSVLLRASHGTSFRPPSLFELYSPISSRPSTVPDPARNAAS
ncbi:MAG TPA: TonB-dependent receptor, partial [Gemmatimonadaceae bacterium]|nr:TonB-dependent receptor [Gemmatimonadaceae bacterium]